MVRIFSFVFMILFFSIWISGCGQDESNNTMQQKENEQLITVQQEEDAPKKLTHKQIADHLAQLATSVPDVKDATAIVAGPYAVVGIDIDKDLDRTRVGTVKYSVMESLKDDPYGAKAVVVADADTLERLKQMQKDIQNGQPISGITDELAAIVGRLMPQIPYERQDVKEPIEQNKQQVENGKEEELEEIQKEQSQQNL